MEKMTSVLQDKEVIAILQGDKEFGEITVEGKSDIKISMPYLSGRDICQISGLFGHPITYNPPGHSYSRWMYFSEMLGYCAENRKESQLLEYLFSKKQFAGKLSGYAPETIESAYAQTIGTVLQKINEKLYFGGYRIIREGEKIFIHKIDSSVIIEAPSVKAVDRQYITELSARAMKDVNNNNYDSALTKARTLLEETFCYVIEKKGKEPSTSGKIKELYSQVEELYNMKHDKEIDIRIHKLLSGLETILSSIAEMRNKASDSHGMGSRRFRIEKHHARLFVNSAMTMADFILAVEERTR